LSLNPTHSHKKGTIIERTSTPKVIRTVTARRKETVWEYGTDYEDSLDIEIQMNKVIKRLKGREERLVEICKRYDLKCMIMIVIKMNEGYTPALIMKKELIEFANNINAEIHLDLYANPYN
jgi:hypothetical protein